MVYLWVDGVYVKASPGCIDWGQEWHWQILSLRGSTTGENELRNLAAGLLPFLLIPELCSRLRERLEQEAQESATTVFINGKLNDINLLHPIHLQPGCVVPD